MRLWLLPVLLIACGGPIPPQYDDSDAGYDDVDAYDAGSGVGDDRAVGDASLPAEPFPDPIPQCYEWEVPAPGASPIEVECTLWGWDWIVDLNPNGLGNAEGSVRMYCQSAFLNPPDRVDNKDFPEMWGKIVRTEQVYNSIANEPLHVSLEDVNVVFSDWTCDDYTDPTPETCDWDPEAWDVWWQHDSQWMRLPCFRFPEALQASLELFDPIRILWMWLWLSDL